MEQERFDKEWVLCLRHHPVAHLCPRDQLVLGVLVESLACRPVTEAEWLDGVRLAHPPMVDLQRPVTELLAGGYIQRSMEDPVRYRPTPAGVDAAIGYGVLRLANERGTERP